MNMKSKISYITLIILLLFQSCDTGDNKEELVGKVSLSKFSVDMFSSPFGGQNRVLQASSWIHQFPPTAIMQIQNSQTGQRYSIEYNPSNPGQSSINLPYGNYTFISEVSAETFSSYLPYTTEGFFSVSSPNTLVELSAKTGYGLVSVKNQFIEKIEILSGGVKQTMSLLQDNSYYFLYIKDRTLITLEIIESTEGKSIIREFLVNANVHNNFILEMKEQGAINVIDLVMGAFDYQEEVVPVNQVGNLPPWLNQALSYGEVQDIDGNNYRTIKIGELTWMAENLKTTRFCNGDVIPEIQGDIEWGYFGQNPAWCYYDNDPKNDELFGKLYKIHATTDNRGLCPCGWRIPTYNETLGMIAYLGGEAVAGGKLKSTGIYWPDSNIGATNESGFSGLYGGYRISGYGDSRFMDKGTRGGWWIDSRTEGFPYALGLIRSQNGVSLFDFMEASPSGVSVRCVQDA